MFFDFVKKCKESVKNSIWRDGCCEFGFWIADFGFPENKNFFEESEFSLAINFQ